MAERLGIPYVELTTDQILEDAHVKSSALHPLLEWDDVAAAQICRRSQIRHVMGHLDVEFTDSKGRIQRMKAFFNVRTNAPEEEEEEEEDPNVECGEEEEEEEEDNTVQRAYVDVEGLSENKNYRKDFVSYCRQKLTYWAEMVRQYGATREFNRVLKAIDDYEAEKK